MLERSLHGRVGVKRSSSGMLERSLQNSVGEEESVRGLGRIPEEGDEE